MKNKIIKKINFKKPVRKIFYASIVASFLLIFSSYYYFANYYDKIMLVEGITTENSSKIAMEKEISELVKGYPMEKMVPYIMQKDPKVAAFLISIAKKESNWGRRVPVLNGQDCFNYWGYRETRDKMGTGGHTCFDNPKDAVDTVGKRIENLIAADINTPSKMIVWKCGFSCEGHSDTSVQKWIADVSSYFNKISK